MTSSPPPVPPDQRSGNISGQDSIAERSPEVTEAAHKVDVNLKEEGDAGNRNQNVNAVQHKVQDR